MNQTRLYAAAAIVVAAGLLGGQYLVHAAEQSGKGGNFAITSSSAAPNVTDLWVVDQASRTVYLCRASGPTSSPTCSKGAALP